MYPDNLASSSATWQNTQLNYLFEKSNAFTQLLFFSLSLWTMSMKYLLLESLFHNFWVTILFWFSFFPGFDSVTFFSALLGWLKPQFFTIVMFFLSQMFWWFQQIMQIIPKSKCQSLDVTVYYQSCFLLLVTANPLPKWRRLT